MKKILSIDGGGIRGIIPGQVLISIEKKLQERTCNPEARIGSYFDFFAGTSTGGILTCILLCPSESDPTVPRFSAKQAVDLYAKYGPDIFKSGLWHRLNSCNGILKEKYDAGGLNDCLQTYFGKLKMSQLIKPCIITSYDIERRQTKFFAQHDLESQGDQADFYVRDVCRATSSAPTYFQPEKIKSIKGASYACIDGGVFANNPSLCAYAEVRNASSDPTAKEMLIVSIGTGSENQSYRFSQAKNWGAIGWVRPVIDIMMSGAAEITNYQLQQLFSAASVPQNYIRIQPAHLGVASPEMDNISPINIQALAAVGQLTAHHCKDIDRIIDILLEGPDPVNFS